MVFLVEQPKPEYDLEPAREFGEISYIFGPGAHRPSVFKVDEYRERVREALASAKFDSKTDYFCMTGSMVPVALCLVTMVSTYGRVRVLMFNAHESRYLLRVLSGGCNGDIGDVAAQASARPR